MFILQIRNSVLFIPTTIEIQSEKRYENKIPRRCVTRLY